MTTATTPRLYVGTYAKYNSGSLFGRWLDLEDYADKEDFLKACAELHKDEGDPEFMFQDFEGFPRAMYSESYVSDELFEWLDLDENDRELLEVYQNGVDQSGTIEQAREAYAGTYDSAKAWAEDFLESTGALEKIPENLRYYFDYEAYARDARGDNYFVEHDGNVWVFYAN